jgi:hypothetical protein
MVALFLVGVSRLAAAADVQLWRLDCGGFPQMDIEEMSDTFAYPGRTKDLTNSCYVIRHDHDFMLWDTGFTPAGADLRLLLFNDRCSIFATREQEVQSIYCAAGGAARKLLASAGCQQQPYPRRG